MQLQYLSITGNDRVAGKLKGPALNELREKKQLGKKLVKLRITDQSQYDKKLDKAIKDYQPRGRNWPLKWEARMREMAVLIRGWEGRNRTDIRLLVDPWIQPVWRVWRILLVKSAIFRRNFEDTHQQSVTRQE